MVSRLFVAMPRPHDGELRDSTRLNAVINELVRTALRSEESRHSAASNAAVRHFDCGCAG
jgi:hypothetical protein